MRRKDLTSRIRVAAKHTFVVEMEVRPPVNLDHYCILGAKNSEKAVLGQRTGSPLLNRSDPSSWQPREKRARDPPTR